MKLSLTVGKRKIFSFDTARRKSSRTIAAAVNEWEEQAGLAPPFDLSQPSQAYRNVSWVYACVSVIQTAVLSVPLKVYQRRGETVEEIFEGSLVRIFQDVNAHQSRADLWEWAIGSLELAGDSYWEIERDGKDIPVALYPMQPSRVKIVPDRETFIRGYIYEVNGKKIALAPEEVFHLRRWNPESDHYGMGSYQAGSRIVTIDTWAQAFNEGFFKNDATPGGALETDEDLDEDSANDLRKRWEKVHRGRNRARRIAILSSGLKYKPTMASMKDMQFEKLRKLNREEICAVFGVPPALVGIFEYANYANAEAQQKMFWKNKVVPLLKKVQEALNQGFVPHFKDPSLYVAFDLSAVEALREDQSDKAEREERLVRSGLRTINELRAVDNFPPVAWGDEPPAQTDGGTKVDTAKFVRADRVNGQKADGSPHYSIDRHLGIILAPAKELLGDLAGAMVGHLKADGRMSRLRAYAERTHEDGEDRNKHRDLEAVDALFEGFDFLKDAAPRIEDDFAEPYKTIYEKGARFGAQKLRRATGKMLAYRSGKEFELVDTNIIRQLAARRAFWLAQGMGNTYDSLELALAREYFDKWQQVDDAELLATIARLFDIEADWQAERIARTETHHIAQKAQAEMFKHADVRIFEWAHSGNPNGRQNHMMLSGKTIDISKGEKFHVGGYTCEHPGDGSLGPGESINCNCDTLPAINKHDEEYSLPDELWNGS